MSGIMSIPSKSGEFTVEVSDCSQEEITNNNKRNGGKKCVIFTTHVNKGFVDDEDNHNHNNHSAENAIEEYSRSKAKFALTWRELSYTVSSVKSMVMPCSTTTFKKKHVLMNMNGQIVAGTMTALMGPSGAGKTTLLNCISNKLQDNGLQGQVSFRTFANFNIDGIKEKEDIRIGFVPQQDHLFIQFSVKETLMFASKMNNAHLKGMRDHAKVVQDCLASLDLSHEADTMIWKLSGGQVKRTSIAVELISRPKILLLDEPTTGLDSDNSEKVVILLKNLTNIINNPPAIIATIHQPSSDVFMMFDQIYLLNRFGSNIYSGSPAAIMSYLESFDFERKEDVNPADYMIEVANAKYGSSKFKAMSETTRISTNKDIEHYSHSRENGGKITEIPISSVRQRQSSGFLRQLFLLFWRSLTADAFKSPITIAKIVLGLACGFLACNLSQEPIGPFDGCWSTMLNLAGVENMTIDDEKTALKDKFFDALSAEKDGMGSQNFDLIFYMSKMREAAMYMLTISMFHMFFYGMAGVLIYPFEFKIIQKEMTNNWYSVTAYYLARAICDSLLLFVCVTPMLIYSHYASLTPGGIMDKSFWITIFIVYMEASIWESRAQLFSIIFSKDIVVAIVFTIGLMFPNTFLSGLYIRVNDLKDFLVPVTRVSDMRYTFESLMLNVYGFGRCKGGKVVDGITNDILKDSSAVNILTNVWHTIPLNHNDGARMSRILNLTTEDYLDDVIDGIDNYLGDPPAPEEGLGYDPTFQSYQSSYMLSFFEFFESDFTYNLGYLMVVMLLTKLAVFVVLKIHSRVKRL
jgi:ABC-type multidrug transport system ATPase subunit